MPRPPPPPMALIITPASPCAAKRPAPPAASPRPRLAGSTGTPLSQPAPVPPCRRTGATASRSGRGLCLRARFGEVGALAEKPVRVHRIALASLAIAMTRGMSGRRTVRWRSTRRLHRHAARAARRHRLRVTATLGSPDLPIGEQSPLFAIRIFLNIGPLSMSPTFSFSRTRVSGPLFGPGNPSAA
jgi:hypothetical protein